jgi:hypothetical protein
MGVCRSVTDRNYGLRPAANGAVATGIVGYSDNVGNRGGGTLSNATSCVQTRNFEDGGHLDFPLLRYSSAIFFKVIQIEREHYLAFSSHLSLSTKNGGLIVVRAFVDGSSQ